MTLPLTVIVASPCAAVVIGVGSFAPLRNATNRSGAGGIEVSPTSSLQLPTASSSANVPPPNTRRPRIANLLTVWGSARPKTALGIPAPRGLFKRPFVIELSGRREAQPAPQKAVDQPVEPAVGEPQGNPVEPPVRGDDHAQRWSPRAERSPHRPDHLVGRRRSLRAAQRSPPESREHTLVRRPHIATQIHCFHLAPDRRLEASRLDHDDSDTKRQQLASQTVRDRFQAELGRRVGPHERQGAASRDRAHVDDATARHLEERQERLRDSNDADQVHLEDPPQLVEREQLERTGGGNPRIIHECYERGGSYGTLHLAPHSRDACSIGHIHPQGRHAVACQRNLILGATHRPEDAKTSSGEVPRDGGTDAGRGSRHYHTSVHPGNLRTLLRDPVHDPHGVVEIPEGRETEDRPQGEAGGDLPGRALGVQGLDERLDELQQEHGVGSPGEDRLRAPECSHPEGWARNNTTLKRRCFSTAPHRAHTSVWENEGPSVHGTTRASRPVVETRTSNVAGRVAATKVAEPYSASTSGPSRRRRAIE